MPTSFHQQSHASHQGWYAKALAGPAAQLHSLRQHQKAHTVFAWQNQRLYRSLLPLLQHCPQSSWLTVGDGRFGTEAHWLARQGVADVLATDISTTLLEVALQEGYIPHYQQENAEELSQADDSWDFVLCKDSYHHFPRPYLALYEMLRVARKGVVLIEPADSLQQMPLLLAWVNLQTRLNSVLGTRLRLYKNQHSFENVGNYVYKISPREIEKTALGLGLRWVAFKPLNFFHHPGNINHPPQGLNPAWLSTRLKHLVADSLRWLGVIPSGMLAALILKQAPTPALARALRKQGYLLRTLPANPYIATALG